ncbi:LytR/AlgR family response regulator transcription factor [Niameybacter massiliensis]|uniref:LytR/AlgR family response regulator transcription factor n=1 Tax=Niameybacter massiliensis TaxID=1658108 RepID=UPI0006B5E1A2|nr:LytTR family DNA-binding domain-containing protein [Niameybacter massiliensis]
MYKIAICEDEVLQKTYMGNLLKKIAKENNVEFDIRLFAAGEQLLEAGYDEYDMIILDIEMGQINGVEVAKRIRQTNKEVKIIFVTGVEKLWPEGYNVNAYRYIVKPVDEQSFSQAIVELLEMIGKSQQYITLKSEGTLERIAIPDIKYLAIQDRKVELYITGRSITTNIPMQEWEEMLTGHGFASPHKSYLVNLQYVSRLNKESLQLTTGEEVYVSKRKYKTFKEEFMMYVEKMN